MIRRRIQRECAPDKIRRHSASKGSHWIKRSRVMIAHPYLLGNTRIVIRSRSPSFRSTSNRATWLSSWNR